MGKQVIKFYADWCNPCKVYAPTFDRVKQDLQDIVEFKEVNVEQDTENLSGEYKVKGIPMTILVVDGQVEKSHSGKMSEDQLKEFILN
jgi:thioredoxin 1